MAQVNKRRRPRKRDVLACCSRLVELGGQGFFKALGDPNRVAILGRLATERGPWTVSRVADLMPIDISVVSRHLATLRDAGILAAERRGKEVHYTVRFGAVVHSLRALADAIEACCPPDTTRGTCC